MTKKLGVIGLGIMGKPMAANLLKAGFQVTVYNRSKAAIDLLTAQGARAASSPKEVAANSDVVITIVTDSSDVEEVVLGPNGVIEGMKPSGIVVDMSTISPAVTRKIAADLKKKNVMMLDAPVSGGDKGAREGTLTIMVGGPKEAFEACLPVFQAMGKKVTHMGENGAGQLTKLTNQILVSVNMIGVCEALVFARKAGLNLETVIDSLSAGAASSWSLVNLGPRAARGDFAPGFKVKLLQKDLRHTLASAEELKLALPAVSLVHQLYNSLEADGLGEEGTQALIRVLEKLSGLGKNS